VAYEFSDADMEIDVYEQFRK